MILRLLFRRPANHMREGQYLDRAADRLGLILELLNFRPRAGQIDGRGKEKVGVAYGELAPFAGACGIDDGQPFTVPGLWIAVAILNLEELAVPIELAFARPDLVDEIEPFLRIAVATLVFARQVEAERFIFRPVPAGDDVEAGATVTDLVNSSPVAWRPRPDGWRRRALSRTRLFGWSWRAARSPMSSFQNGAVEIGLAAVTDPARDRQHEVDAGVIEDAPELIVVLPGRRPSVPATWSPSCRRSNSTRTCQHEIFRLQNFAHSLFPSLCVANNRTRNPQWRPTKADSRCLARLRRRTIGILRKTASAWR